MLLIRTKQDLKCWRKSKDSVGLVPTMGEIHEGHIDLKINQFVVVSIYVNPAQFSPNEDLDKYPRNNLLDEEKLRETGMVDVLFLPLDEEMYPDGITTHVNKQKGTFIKVEQKSELLEGLIRPHFFRGVCTVVAKLLNIALPTHLYLGQKDAQQCVILKSMIKDLCYDIKVIVVPTSRNKNGLALSSRNIYLNSSSLIKASAFYNGLCLSLKIYENGVRCSKSIINVIFKEIKKEPELRIQYIKLTHPNSLEEIENIGEEGAILSGAVIIDNIRLIDNILLGCQL